MNDIQLAEVCQRIAQNPSIHFVFGRQGSGKTRIAEKMSEEKLGVPMLTSGIAMTFPFEKEINNPKLFWIGAAIAALVQSEGRRYSISRALACPAMGTKRLLSNSYEILQTLCAKKGSDTKPIPLLVDSIDLIDRNLLPAYADALFEFMRTAMSEKDLARVFRVVVFCRPETKDLAPENMEQLAHSARCVYL